MRAKSGRGTTCPPQLGERRRKASAGLAFAAFVTVLAARSAYAQARVTFNRDVAPIVWSHCATCHRPGAVGPFSLITYDDVKRRATLVRDVTARRLMPPWKPTDGKGDFADARRLTDGDLATLQRWIADGAPEGNRADLPPQPHWETGWQLGVPDLVVTMPKPFTVQAEGRGGDVFRTFVLPIPIMGPRYVRAIEFRPDNARVVHHANLGIDRTHSSRLLDAKDDEAGYSGGMVQDARYPEGQMLGWTPGQAPHAAPPGMQWRLDPDSDLIVQMHLQPTGKPEQLIVSAAFYFTDEVPARQPQGLRLGSETIDIAAGTSRYVVEDRYVLPVNVELVAIQPHAHNLARRMEATAERPDGTRVPLIEIVDWDFRWQDVYRYRSPILLVKGATVSMRYEYDNSAANPRNPRHPPARVVWGENTSDEMGDLWLQIVPVDRSDQAALSDSLRRKAGTEDLAAYTKLLDTDRGNPLRHDAVARILYDLGRTDEAAVEYERSLALNPSSASTHYNLGVAYSARNRRDDAKREFEAALRLDPDYAQAHNNLGALLFLAGAPEEAEGHYRRAIVLRPDNVEAHTNLAALLSARGRLEEAVAEFRQALALQSGSAAALSGLAWIRATAPDPALRNGDEAVTFAERALSMTGASDLSVLDALAAAYAEVGRFDDAVAATDWAVGRARVLGMIEVASRFEERAALYRQHHPFRTAAPAK